MTAIKRVRSGPRESTKRRNVKSSLSLATDHRSRTEDYLDATEIDLLLKAAKAGRYGTRDSLLLMMLYRHGLRVSEAISLRVTDVNLQQARLWVNRLKNGLWWSNPFRGMNCVPSNDICPNEPLACCGCSWVNEASLWQGSRWTTSFHGPLNEPGWPMSTLIP